MFQHCLKVPLWPRDKFAYEGEAVEPAPPSEINLKPRYGGSILTSVVPSSRTRVCTRHPFGTEKISGFMGHLLLLGMDLNGPGCNLGFSVLEFVPP